MSFTLSFYIIQANLELIILLSQLWLTGIMPGVTEPILEIIVTILLLYVTCVSLYRRCMNVEGWGQLSPPILIWALGLHSDG